MLTRVGALLIVLGTHVAIADVARTPAPAPARVPVTAPIVGATKVHEIVPGAGFIDDAVAATAQHLAYVVGDGGNTSALHVVELATKAEQIVDLSTFTLHPHSLHFVGTNVVVVGAALEGPGMIAALVDLPRAKTRPFPYKLAGPAIGVLAQAGKPRLVVRDVQGGKHTVTLHDATTGKRMGAPKSFELDASGHHAKLDFRVNHWSAAGTRAHGIKGGTWNKRDDARSPDVEATYDLLAGKFVEQKPIGDLHEQRRRFQALAETKTDGDFVRLDWNQAGFLVVRGGKLAPLELDQPFTMYLRETLQAHVTADATWLALKVDKVHPDAVARKKADVEYLDVFHAGLDHKATRKARVFAGAARHRFGTVGKDRFYLVERNATVDRGGTSLVIYQVP